MIKVSLIINKKIITSIAMMGALLALPEIAGADGSLGDVALHVTKSMSGVARLITAASYVAGVGFALMGLLKFKAHKDQPQQVPLSQPLVLLTIAAGLIFLPEVIKTTGATVWGDTAISAGPTGNLFPGV